MKMLKMLIMYVSFSVLYLVSITGTTWAGTASLSWNPDTDSDLAGYKIYYGTASSNYTQIVNVGMTSTPSAPRYDLNLSDGNTYYFVVTAYDTAFNESGPSNEVFKLIGTTTGGGGSGGANPGVSSGGGCGMIRVISKGSGSSAGQVFLNLVLLGFLISLGKLHALLKEYVFNTNLPTAY